MIDYRILYSHFPDGGGELILPNVTVEPVPYHNFLLLLQGHNFPILCGCLLPVSGTDTHWETHISLLEKKHRNKGYGKLLYEYMINFGRSLEMTIVSSVDTSKSAKRVWESLSNKYNIVYSNKRYRVINE